MLEKMIEELQDIQQTANTLQDRLRKIGYEMDVRVRPIKDVVANDPIGVAAPKIGTAAKHKSRNMSNAVSAGVQLYWDNIRRIEVEHGVDRKEAMRIYREQKEEPIVGRSTQVRSNPHRDSKLRYWKKIRKIAADRGIDLTTARRIYQQENMART